MIIRTSFYLLTIGSVLFFIFFYAEKNGWNDKPSDVYECTHLSMWRDTHAAECARILSHGWKDTGRYSRADMRD
jgi:hypothetical protein